MLYISILHGQGDCPVFTDLWCFIGNWLCTLDVFYTWARCREDKIGEWLGVIRVDQKALRAKSVGTRPLGSIMVWTPVKDAR